MCFDHSMKLPHGVKHTDWPAIGALLTLSALWATAWLRADLSPGLRSEELPNSVRQAVLFSVFTAVAAVGTLVRRGAFPRGRNAWACFGLGLGLFVVPAALTTLAEGWISAFEQVAIFSLTPVFAVVLEPHLQDHGPRQGRAALPGALAALSGALCLFSLDVPNSLRAGVGLCALLVAVFVIAAANCKAVQMASEVASGTMLPIAALAACTGAMCFSLAAGFTLHTASRWRASTSELLWLLVTDLPGLILLFWLMGRMSASRMATRFLLAPLFAILGGIAFEPAVPPLRAIVGILLLAGGAGWLVLAPPEKNGEEDLNSLSEPRP